MTGSVNFSNHQWLVRSMDGNRNGNMDELRFNEGTQELVDTDRNGSVSEQEMVSALKADKVEIQQGQVLRGRGFNIHVNGLDTLKSVRSVAGNGISNIHVWTPTMYSDDTARERYNKLYESNHAYDRGIDQMENALRNIVNMTDGKTDATSRALNIQAKTTLNSTQWRTWTARLQQNLSNTRVWFNDYKPGEKMAQYNTPQGGSGTTANTQDPFANSSGKPSGGSHTTDPFAKPNGGASHTQDPFANGNNPNPGMPVDPYADRLAPHIREQEQIFASMQASYETMHSSLKAIQQQVADLPDLQQTVRATDSNISKAFANLGAIENSGKSGKQVADNIRKEADATDAKATGRTVPYLGIGAGIGAVAGAAIGYFANGKNITKAAIWGAAGAALGGGGGALIGNGIDSGYKGQASSLRDLAGRVESYNPANDKAQVINANQTLYNQLFNARTANDLDRARVVNNDVSSINSRVTPVIERSNEILGAHQKY